MALLVLLLAGALVLLAALARSLLLAGALVLRMTTGATSAVTRSAERNSDGGTEIRDVEDHEGEETVVIRTHIDTISTTTSFTGTTDLSSEAIPLTSLELNVGVRIVGLEITQRLLQIVVVVDSRVRLIVHLLLYEISHT